MQSIGEMWARSVDEKTRPQKVENAVNPALVKPVKDNETESRKARFRQNILNINNKQKEQPTNG